MQATPAPVGFEPYELSSPYVRHCGITHIHRSRPVLGMRLCDQHLNLNGTAHGGLLATLADAAFSQIIRLRLGIEHAPTTASLNIDYLGTVRLGDWVEAEVEILKMGQRVINATCRIRAGERVVLMATAILLQNAAPAVTMRGSQRPEPLEDSY